MAAETETGSDAPADPGPVSPAVARTVSPAAAGAAAEAASRAPEPDEVWRLPSGTAWIYYGHGRRGLARPVVLADGFSTGPTELDLAWELLDRGAYPFLTRLRESGRGLVLTGFDERSASVPANAENVRAAVLRAIARRRGRGALTVGGFSMGGVVSRYALTKLEHEGVDHRTGLYVSYDSPHHGAWLPICLQAFAHYLRPLSGGFSAQINSPAARQLLWRHLAQVGGTPAEDPARTAFLAELRSMGWWPRRCRRIGVANGAGRGTGNGVPAGAEALSVGGLVFNGTRLYTQAAGEDPVVGKLRSLVGRRRTVRAGGLPELDGAPGGLLESFGTLADELDRLGRTRVHHRSVCFVPTVSALAVRGARLDRQEDLYADLSGLPAEASELDEFRCASTNEAHTLMTEELGSWILDRLPD
ncbi:hypothetical protein [Streptomyces sp. NPDC018031]|uniref:hypothetical protein n=1 Tax=Streptomyces sp. NPDC018031 TaxID=3365033 RepID=UPI0037887A20